MGACLCTGQCKKPPYTCSGFKNEFDCFACNLGVPAKQVKYMQAVDVASGMPYIMRMSAEGYNELVRVTANLHRAKKIRERQREFRVHRSLRQAGRRLIIRRD